jgi:hypothetical protein
MLYIEGFGLNHSEARQVLLSFNGGPMKSVELGSYREFLVTSVANLFGDAFNRIEGAIWDNKVSGDLTDNLTKLDGERDDRKRLLAELADLNEGQAREIYGYAIGFWNGLAEASGHHT